MDALGSLWLLAKLVVLIAGLLLPGAALMRALRAPVTLATAFAGSAVAIYAVVLALQWTDGRICFGTMAAGLVAIILVARLVGRGGTAPRMTDEPSLLSRAGLRQAIGDRGAGWLLIYGLFWLAVLWRAAHEPLAGPDVEFRWRYLAEQMLRLGSLDFYPPHTAADFTHYFWAESIPPGVAALHAWAFACGDSAAAGWTMPAVMLQLIALHELIGRSAHRAGGAHAGLFACLLAAACPVLTWSVLLGQETGFTALALLGIVFALQEARAEPSGRWAVLLGVFAVLGASAREYGLVFPLIAGAGLLAVRAGRRAWLTFLPAAALAGAWAVVSLVRTGNPFYSLPFASLPTNPRFVTWVQHDSAVLGAPLGTAAGWRDTSRYLLLYAPAALAGWVALAFVAGRRRAGAAALLVAVALFAGLWLASVPYTNGGMFYSLRVLAPAVAVGALAAGVGLGALAGGRWGRVAEALAAASVFATLPATLALPSNPLRTPVAAWPAFAPRSSHDSIDPTLAVVLRSGEPGVVLADAPGFQTRFLPHGITVIPPWSPQADWLFERMPPAEAARRWRESGVRHLIVTKYGTNLDFFNRHSRWTQPPFQVQLIGESPEAAVFSIRAVE